MQRRVEDELAAVLYKQAWAAILSLFLLIFIHIFILLEVVPREYLLLWAAVNFLNTLTFLFSTLQYQKDPKAHSSAYWLKRYTLHAVSHGILWSAIGPLVLHYGNFQYQVFILFVFAGMAAGAIGSRGFITKTFIAEVTPLFLPTFVYLLTLDQSLYSIMASLVVIYYFFLLFIVKNYSQTTGKTIHLLIQNESLVENLRTSNWELENSNQRLEKEIVKRKQIEQQLNKDKEKAESIGQAKSRFIANMSHEFRTPLNAIIGFGEILKGTRLDEKQNEYVENIVVSSNHLIDLVNDVLDISRIESGKVSLSYEYVDIYKLIDEVINITSTSAVNKALVIIKNIEPNVPQNIYVDGTRIKQILLNLINNAIKFTNQGYIKLTAYYNTADELLNFEVEDTGVGVSQDNQKDLFNAFTQLENFEMNRQQGAGLGLTITRNLAEIMQGNVVLTSEEGKGSVFHVQLPVTVGDRSSTEKAISACCYIAIENPLFDTAISNSLRICGIELVTREQINKQCFVICDRQLEAETLRQEFNLNDEHIINFKPISIDKNDITPYSSFQQIKSRLGYSLPEIQQNPHTPKIDNLIRVLVADDNRLNRLVIKSFLEDEKNITVIEAEDGQQVLDLVMKQNQDFDLVLMDIQMPQVSGIEATQIIREEGPENVSSLPIIAVTAHAMPEYQKLIMSRGFNDCLVKPISQQQLLETIEQWV